MALLLLKALVSGLVVAAANVAANRLSPTLGGWIAAFPLISFLSVTWLWLDGKPGAEASGLLVGVLWGLIPTAVLLLGVALLARHGVPLPLSMALGTTFWIAFTLTVEKLGLFGT